MNDDLTLLASAYLDDDVTSEERARVEGDAEMLAEVERLRSVRALLGDLEPASISVREAQLAAALATWDRLPETERNGARGDWTPAGVDGAAIAGAASVSVRRPVNGRRRTMSPRWLAGAAAAMVLVLAGGVALQLGSGNDNDESTSADVTSAADATESLAATGPADEPARIDPGTGQASADEGAGDLDTGVADPPPPGEEAGLIQLRNLTDLADFAATAVGAPRASDVPAATSPPGAAGGSEGGSDDEIVLEAAGLRLCLGADLIVGPAVYGDVAVVVGIDEGRNLALAYQAADCTEVARVRLP